MKILNKHPDGHFFTSFMLLKSHPSWGNTVYTGCPKKLYKVYADFHNGSILTFFDIFKICSTCPINGYQ